MKYFKEREFSCPDCNLGFDDINEDAIRALDQARGYAGVPFKITSSIRCKKHNKEVGGKKSSSHLTGVAFDIACDSSYNRYRILHGLLKAGFNRIGVAEKFLHCDVDNDKPKELIWVY